MFAMTSLFVVMLASVLVVMVPIGSHIDIDVCDDVVDITIGHTIIGSCRPC